MRLVKTLLLVVLVLLLLAIGIGFMLPDQAKIERQISIDAPPATVYTVLNGFHQFNNWSPWADLDPQTIYTFDGPPMGAGARYSWSSDNPNVGAGDQQILEAKPYSSIKIRLHFDRMDIDNQLVYELAPHGAGTELKWIYQSQFNGNLLNRYFGLAVDKMIGPDFDKGLLRLKAFCESLPKAEFTVIQPELSMAEAKPIAYVVAEAPFETSAPVIAAAYAKIGEFLTASGRHIVDAPMTITRDFNPQTRVWKFNAAIPIDQACTSPSEDDPVQCGKSYSGWVVRARHVGPYATMDHSFATLEIYLKMAGLAENGSRYEQYVNDPTTTAPDALLTMLYAPVK